MSAYELSNQQWKNKLTSFNNSVKKVRELGHVLAMAALAQANEHGNTNKLNDLFEACTGAVSRDGLVKWAVEFGCCSFKDGTFKYVKREKLLAQLDAVMEKANALPFWEFSAAQDVQEAKPLDLLESLARIIQQAKKAEAPLKEGERRRFVGLAHKDLLSKIERMVSETVEIDHEVQKDVPSNLELAKQLETVVEAVGAEPVKAKRTNKKAA